MKKYAVITGASSGIGKEFAYQLSSRYNLILIARRKQNLIEITNQCDCDCMIIQTDLTSEEECFKVFDKIKDKDIEVFINNAGFGDCGYFIDNDLNKEMKMIDLNIKAVHIFTKLMLKYFKNQHGYILNVASSAGLMPAGPYMSVYYATKSYVTSFTRGINKELKECHSLTYLGCLCPGPVESEFNKNANVKFALKAIGSKQCVEYTIKKMFQKKIVIIPTMKMRLAMTLGRFLPQSLYIHIASFQQKKKIYK